MSPERERQFDAMAAVYRGYLDSRIAMIRRMQELQVLLALEAVLHERDLQP